jgi:hypothetical protein
MSQPAPAPALVKCWFVTSAYANDVKDFCVKEAEYGVQGAACHQCRGKKFSAFDGYFKGGAWCPTGMKDFGDLPREPETVHTGQMENLIPTEK